VWPCHPSPAACHWLKHRQAFLLLVVVFEPCCCATAKALLLLSLLLLLLLLLLLAGKAVRSVTSSAIKN
jgi:hypothetical protein